MPLIPCGHEPDIITLRVGASFTPWIRLYSPDSLLVAQGGGLTEKDGSLTVTAPTSGIDTVTVEPLATGY